MNVNNLRQKLNVCMINFKAVRNSCLKNKRQVFKSKRRLRSTLKFSNKKLPAYNPNGGKLNPSSNKNSHSQSKITIKRKRNFNNFKRPKDIQSSFSC